MAEKNVKINVKTNMGYDTLHPQSKADIINYNNSNSNLTAENVQQAIDELNNLRTEADATILTLEDAINENGRKITNLQSVVDDKQNNITGGASTITTSNLTANRVLISNASGKVTVSAITNTELGYLDGVTSNVQTQLNGKSNTSHTHTAATTSTNGFLAAADKVKLNTLITAKGSWTPVLSCSSGQNATLSAKNGTYKRYGDIVILQCNLTCSSISAIPDGTGLILKGFPYTFTKAIGICKAAYGLANTTYGNNVSAICCNEDGGLFSATPWDKEYQVGAIRKAQITASFRLEDMFIIGYLN